MAFVYYKHAEVDRYHPRALAVCDRCGLVYNHHHLRWQFDWMGAKIANLRILVCHTCQDKEQEQRRQIVLPRDPIPIEQARIEPAIAELSTLPSGSVPTPFGADLAAPTNTTALTALSSPVPANMIDPLAQNASATRPSSYFAFNQDLGAH